jgi:hypothetical protein
MTRDDGRYKCNKCHLVFAYDDGTPEVPTCPECGNTEPEEMCPNDVICTCMHDVQAGVHYCSICGEPTCECGSHDVSIVSRVTGYLSDVGGWNAAKRQELKDRQRVTV